MPIHDWGKDRLGTFQTFHSRWSGELMDAMNDRLPPGFSAMAEKINFPTRPDVSTYKKSWDGNGTHKDGGGAVLLAEPKTSVMLSSTWKGEMDWQRHVAVRAEDRSLVAILEIISPWNKSFTGSKPTLDKLLQHRVDWVHIMLVDVVPNTRAVPDGLHALFWERFEGAEAPLYPGKPYVQASYESRWDGLKAFLEPKAVGDDLGELPLCIMAGKYISVPLEETYMRAFAKIPKDYREPLEF